jgi:tetratricopeptide (TPR) repeat protein
MKLSVLALLCLVAGVSCFAQDRAREQEMYRHAADLRRQGDVGGGAEMEFLRVYALDDSAIQEGDCKVLAADLPMDGLAHMLVAENVLVVQHNLDRAYSEYEKALSIQGELDSGEAYLLMGRMLSYFSRPDQALAGLREAVRRKPGLFEAHVGIGNILAQRGDAQGAVAEYRLALKITPDSALAHEKLGRVLVVTGDSEQGKREFARALLLDSGYLEIVNKDLARVEEWNREMQERVQYREQAVRDPQVVAHYLGFYYSAEFAAQKGDYDQAVADLRKAFSMAHPKEVDDELRRKIAYTLWLKGDLRGAIAEYEPLKESNGDDSYCTYDLLLLEKGDMVAPLRKDVSDAFAYEFGARSQGSGGMGEGSVGVSSCANEQQKWFQEGWMNGF